MITIDFSQGWHVSPAASESPTAALAAAELQGTLERITGQPMAGDDAPLQLVLSHNEGAGERLRWQAAPERVALRGDGPRSLLYAVYSFLEALGCRWPAPGPELERLARGTEFELPGEPVEEGPALPGRCLIIAHYIFMQQAEAWIVWAARNRLNTIFFHTIDDPLPLGATPERQYYREREAAIALARERGMTLEVGGHGLSALLPRENFERMPGAFRYHEGQRTPDYNLCPSDPGALATLRRSAQVYFEAHPEADVYHLWPDDLAEGGWCSCTQCTAYTPSDQALLATNAIAEVLEVVNPDAQISFLAYHDTESMPRRVEPRHNVCLLWAPRMRCYAHAADEPTCPVNTPRYGQGFAEQVMHFEAAGAAPTRVFEYYLDAILFKSVLPPMPGIIQRDLHFYQQAGAHTVQALMTGDRPWFGPQVNAWLFARLAWDPVQDVDTLLADFGAAVFGMPADASAHEVAARDIVMYYHSLEAAYALALNLVPEEINLQVSDDPLAVLRDPPVDMADPYFAPPAVLHTKAAREAVIPDLLEQAAAHLSEIAGWANADALHREQVEFDLHDAWLRFDLARVRLYNAVVNQTGDARELYVEARAMLDRVYEWGERHIDDPRHRTNFRFLHALFWQLRLDKLYAEAISGPPRGWLVKGRDAVELGLLLRRMTGIYDEAGD